MHRCWHRGGHKLRGHAHGAPASGAVNIVNDALRAGRHKAATRIKQSKDAVPGAAGCDSSGKPGGTNDGGCVERPHSCAKARGASRHQPRTFSHTGTPSNRRRKTSALCMPHAQQPLVKGRHRHARICRPPTAAPPPSTACSRRPRGCRASSYRTTTREAPPWGTPFQNTPRTRGPQRACAPRCTPTHIAAPGTTHAITSRRARHKPPGILA